MIKELIVVEGKDDISAVRRAVDADVICTGGYGITQQIMDVIGHAAKTKGAIIFTDPDFAGEKIRRFIQERIPLCKHAYLPRHLGKRENNIGIENARPQDIRDALAKVQTVMEGNNTFILEDLVILGLMHHPDSQNRRRFVGEKLGIGYCNGKQFLKRLNHFGVTRTQLINVINQYKV
ncbi:MAG: ribonuclease M5 [Eubacteriales bacterium]